MEAVSRKIEGRSPELALKQEARETLAEPMKPEVRHDPIVFNVFVQAKVDEISARDESSEATAEASARREWLEGRLHYIEHALESLLNGSQLRCRLCGETLGPGILVSDPATARLCLICQRNSGLNAKYRTP